MTVLQRLTNGLTGLEYETVKNALEASSYAHFLQEETAGVWEHEMLEIVVEHLQDVDEEAA